MAFQILGSSNNGTSGLVGGYAVIGKFYCATTGRATHLYIYQDNTCNYKFAVYEDNAGSPGDAVYIENSPRSVTGNGTSAFRSLTITDPFVVTGGAWYWLAAATDTSSCLYRNSNGLDSYRKNIAPFSTFTFSDPQSLATWSSYGYEICLYLYGDEVTVYGDNLTNTEIDHTFNTINYWYAKGFDNLSNTSFDSDFSTIDFSKAYIDNLINRSFEHTFSSLTFVNNWADSFINTGFEHTFNTTSWDVSHDIYDSFLNKAINSDFGPIAFIANLSDNFTNKTFTLTANSISADIFTVDISLGNTEFTTSFSTLFDFVNNSNASFKFISDSFTGRTSADAEAITSLDMGSFLWGQTKEVKFRIGNDSESDINFGLLAESANNDIMNNVRFSLDGKNWKTYAHFQLKPNAVSDIIHCRLEMPTTAYIDDGTFLINVLRQS